MNIRGSLQGFAVHTDRGLHILTPNSKGGLDNANHKCDDAIGSARLGSARLVVSFFADQVLLYDP